MRRILTISGIVVLLGLIASIVGVRYYLRSRQVVQQVTTQLEALYGGPVRVGEVDVGLASTTISGFELFESGSDHTKDAPWLKVGSLNADVSLWDLVSGAARPTRVTLKGASVLFRLNRAGDLLTRFPKQATASGIQRAHIEALAEAMFEKGEIIFRKDGRGDLTVTNVSARLTNQAGRLVLSGSGDNADLGKVLLDGSLEKESSVATVHVKTEARAHVTQAFLDRLPFVPAEVWDEIQIAETDTTAELTVACDLKQKAVRYRVDLDPQNTKLFVPAIDLAAHAASGKVTIDDNLVLLRDVKGQAFAGSLFTQADLDFRGTVRKLAFTKIKVEDLDIRELPEDWNIPVVVRKSIARGKLFGNAALEVTIRPALNPVSACTVIGMAGGAGFSSGQWFAGAAVITALPVHEVRAQSQGKGQVRDPAGKSEPIEFDWQIVPRRSRSGDHATKSARIGAQEDFTPVIRPREPESRSTSNAATSCQLVGSSPADKLAACRYAQIEHFVVALLTSETIFPRQEEKQKPTGSPNYLDTNLNLKNANLADVIKNLDVKLPFPVDGKISFQVKASIPIDRLDNSRAYKVHGSAQIAQLVMAGLKVEEVNAEFSYADGSLFLTSLKGRIASENIAEKDPGGTLQGSGQIQLEPLGELRASLLLDRIPIHKLADVQPNKVQGALSGKLSLRARADKLQSVKALCGEGTISGDQLKIFGMSLQQVATTVRLKDGVLTLPDLRGQLEGTPVDGLAELRLEDDYPFLAKLDLRDWSLASLQRLAVPAKGSLPGLDGAFSTSVALQGKLTPFKVSVSGDAKARNLKVDAFQAQTVKFHWETNGERLDVKDLDALLYEGKTTGTAVLPFDPKASGKLDLRIHDLNVKQLSKDLRVPFKMEGNVDGTLKGTLPPVGGGKARTATFHVDLRAPKLRVQNIPTEQLHGTVEYQKGMLDYKLEGKSLGGTFDLEGQIPAGAKPEDANKEKVKKGRLSIQNVQVARLFNALSGSQPEFGNQTRHLRGAINLEVHFTHDTPDRFPAGQGILRITNLRWKDTRLAENLQADVFLSEQQIRLRNLGGDIAQGTYSGQVTYYLRQPERSWFTLNLDRVESGQILAAWLEKKIEGPIQARIRGNFGGGWRGSADFELVRGKVFGLEVAQWRLPVHWSFAPSQNRGQIEVHETGAQLARGRASGKMILFWDQSPRVEGYLRLDDVELQDLLRQTIGASELGGGRTTARFDFKGNDVRALKDIGGTLVASFNQAQALQVPVLKQVAPYLGVGPSTTFQKGDLRARLDRGVIRIQQMTMQGNNLQLYLDGTVTLEERLNLQVVAKTGDLGLPTARLGPVALRVPLAGPVPLVLLQQASVLLSNHVIYLDVTGTARDPVIRARPLAILSQEAVRFFLNRSNLPVTLNP